MSIDTTTSFRTVLTPAERAGLWKLGAALALAERQMLPSEFDARICAPYLSLEKEAQWQPVSDVIGGAGKLLAGGAKTIAVSAILAGVPLGLVTHAMTRRANEVRNKERDIEAQIEYYTEASRQLEKSMAGSGL